MTTEPAAAAALTSGLVCCECLRTMSVRESIEDAIYLGPGRYLCFYCQHPTPVLRLLAGRPDQ